MGYDSQGFLYYGFPITRREDYGSKLKLRADRYDLECEWEDLYRPKAPEDTSDRGNAEWDAWRERLKEWEKTPQNIEINWSGSEDCERYYVHAAGLCKQVLWSDQSQVTPEMLAPHPEADKWIEKYCEFAGIKYQQPGWYLAARYW